MTLAPVPRSDISTSHGTLTPTWQAWFYQLYSFVTSLTPGSPVPSSRQILTTPPLVGGGNLSADLTLAISANGITNALLAQMPANSLKGNNTGATANALDLSVAQVNALLGTPVGANPTASVGLTAVNGAATTFLRSDGAPALSQAIVPTWSGQHTFTLAPIFSAPLLATSGGTGFASYTQGDLLYASSGTALSKLADVAAGAFLRSGGVGANPAWSSITVPNAAVLGDLWYGSAASVVSALAGNTTATNKFLVQTGTGAVSAAPSWATIASSDLPGSFSGFANPSASLGLSAVNGSATTAMRSDGAPALSQSIAPTWSGTHTFTPQAVFTGGSTNAATVIGTHNWSTDQGAFQATTSTVPMFSWNVTGQAANARLWRAYGVGLTLTLDSSTDNQVTASNILVITRTAGSNALASLAFGNATDNPTYSFLGTGTPKHGGSQIIQTSAALTNNAGALTATLTNSPTTGNPTKWIPINDNGTVRNIPAW